MSMLIVTFQIVLFHKTASNYYNYYISVKRLKIYSDV